MSCQNSGSSSRWREIECHPDLVPARRQKRSLARSSKLADQSTARQSFEKAGIDSERTHQVFVNIHAPIILGSCCSAGLQFFDLLLYNWIITDTDAQDYSVQVGVAEYWDIVALGLYPSTLIQRMGPTIVPNI